MIHKPLEVPVVASVHTPMYLIHKYWARKPHNVVAANIAHYTSRGNVVCDPFCGSGVTVLEAVASGRRAVGVDIDPVAILLTSVTGMLIPARDLLRGFDAVSGSAKAKIMAMYTTTCPKCGQSTAAIRAAWQRGKAPLRDDGQLVRLRVRCEHCGYDEWKTEMASDDDAIARGAIAFADAELVPSVPLLKNPRINLTNDAMVADLFVGRARAALSILLGAINGLDNGSVADALRLVFTSALAQTSKLHSIDFRPGREWQSRGWTVRGYWIPEAYLEDNVWCAFSTRFERLLAGKKDAQMRIHRWKQAECQEDMASGANVLLHCGSATRMPFLADESVDYLFTDPPYGDYVPYLELNRMWSGWLGYDVDLDGEIIISDSPERNKDFDSYRLSLRLAFEEMFRVLKRDRWLTVTFHNQKTAVWNALVGAADAAGFQYINDVYELPAVVSARAQLAPATSLTGDMIINFRKTGKLRLSPKRTSSPEDVVVSEARQIIAERGGQATNDQVMRGVVHRLITQGLLETTAEDISSILERGFKKVSRGAWGLPEDQSPPSVLDYVPLHKRIEWIVAGILADGPKRLDEILVGVYRRLKNGRTPEAQDVLGALRRIAEVENGSWRRREDLEEEQELDFSGDRQLPATEAAEPPEAGEEHSYFVALLARLGQERGYNVYIGKHETERDAALRGLSLSELTISGLDSPTTRSVEQVDVIWLLRRSIPVALFEVENSTKFVKGIRRMGDLVVSVPHLVLKCLVVAPDNQERGLREALKAPSLPEQVRGEDWGYILYTQLLDFYEHRLPGRAHRVDDLFAAASNPNRDSE
jgi:16S rRNA G966 N2-methylase RsmD